MIAGRYGAILENDSYLPARTNRNAPSVRLTDLPRRIAAAVERVEDHMPNDAIARRLRELGFVAGEAVEVIAAGPVGAEPLLVQVGFTRFALRRAEADRVLIRREATA